jgi:hypothetical protein
MAVMEGIFAELSLDLILFLDLKKFKLQSIDHKVLLFVKLRALIGSILFLEERDTFKRHM